MQYKFTFRAEQVLQVANDIAISLGHKYVGTEHVLYGLAKEGSGVASKVLENQNITSDIIIDKIKADANFKKRIETIVEKYGKSKTFDTNKHNKEADKEYKLLRYLNTDLKLALNNTTINVIGKKSNKKWNLDITILDVYDFTDYKELQELKDSDGFWDFAGNLANNAAMISTSCGLINQYNVTIKFSIEY